MYKFSELSILCAICLEIILPLMAMENQAHPEGSGSAVICAIQESFPYLCSLTMWVVIRCAQDLTFERILSCGKGPISFQEFSELSFICFSISF